MKSGASTPGSELSVSGEGRKSHCEDSAGLELSDGDGPGRWVGWRLSSNWTDATFT